MDKGSKKLTICEYEKPIIEDVKNHKVVLIRGQTGCGKSTQIPQYLLNSFLKKERKIAIVLPRTVAALSLSNRVSEELHDKDVFSHKIRFSSSSTPKPRITYMHVALMLKIMNDSTKRHRYQVIIIDDAHERSMETDILLGKMTRYLNEDDELRLIIMAAVFDVENMKKYFKSFDPLFIDIKRRASKVNTLYRSIEGQDYIKTILDVIKEITDKNEDKPNNRDILIFLPTEQKVLEFVGILKREEKGFKGKHKIMEFFTDMLPDKMNMVIQPCSYARKIIVSTNVLETSVTIDGLKYVIDCGLVRRSDFNNEQLVEWSYFQSISFTESEQRKGRVGRTNEGVCYRIYDDPFETIIERILKEELKKKQSESEELETKNLESDELEDMLKENKASLKKLAENVRFHYEGRAASTIKNLDEYGKLAPLITKFLWTDDNGRSDLNNLYLCITDKILNCPYSQVIPNSEISRCNYMTLIVRLLSLQEADVFNFPFMEPPDEDHMRLTMTRLTELSIIEQVQEVKQKEGNQENCSNERYKLTNIGRRISRLPIDPRMGKVLIMAIGNICSYETIVLAVLLQVITFKTNLFYKNFYNSEGDLFLLLNLYVEWVNTDESLQKLFCDENGLNMNNMLYAEEEVNKWVTKLDRRLRKKKLNKNILIPLIENTKLIFLSGYCHNLAIVQKKNELKCALTGEKAKFDDESYFSNVRNGHEIGERYLYLKMSEVTVGENKWFTLNNVIKLENDVLNNFIPEKFKVDATMWDDVIKQKLKL